MYIHIGRYLDSAELEGPHMTKLATFNDEWFKDAMERNALELINLNPFTPTLLDNKILQSEKRSLGGGGYIK